ncbi:MAG TPA: hypothetical protein VIR00_08075 [Micromonosporaceae bacterium]|jgi:hypothetical protein
MGDMLATAAQLGILMQDTGLDEDLATLLLELATGEVQGMARQRLVAVQDDQAVLIGSGAPMLELPQRPVTAVTTVTVDGDAVTDWTWPGRARWLHRGCGWGHLSTVAVTYDHGYAADDWRLVPAQNATLGLARQVAVNPSGVESESIDDYRVQYAASLAAAAAAADNLRSSLRRLYGEGAGMVRV